MRQSDDLLQNDDPNRQVVSYLGKLKNKEVEQKSAPLKTNETDPKAEAEPRTEPEPEGNHAMATFILTHHFRMRSLGFVAISALFIKRMFIN